MKSVLEYLNESTKYVSVDTNAFENEYGKKPKGIAGWAFKINGKEFSFSGSYSEAVKKAKERASNMGVYSITLMI